MSALADLLVAHRGAFEHDWRARFSLPLSEVGRSMTWGEALRLTRLLTADPSSYVCAALAGWEFPASREALVLMDLYDLTLASLVKKPKPYPRPWPDRVSKTAKPDASLTQEEIVAALRKAGHTAEIPTR